MRSKPEHRIDSDVKVWVPTRDTYPDMAAARNQVHPVQGYLVHKEKGYFVHKNRGTSLIRNWFRGVPRS